MGPNPTLGTNFNVFGKFNNGSVDQRQHYAALRQRSVGSNPTSGPNYGNMMELADMSALEADAQACGFESHYSHQKLSLNITAV